MNTVMYNAEAVRVIVELLSSIVPSLRPAIVRRIIEFVSSGKHNLEVLSRSGTRPSLWSTLSPL
jgi:acid phosphatase family membrane protein YuiD